MTMMIGNAKNAWRERGYSDASAGRAQRAPLRDDSGEAFDAYMAGYKSGMRELGRKVSDDEPQRRRNP